jgi:hypothetical protein
MSIRGQLKLALVLFYILAFFMDDVMSLQARMAALIVLVGIFGYLVGTRKRDL